jgi:hypothetical protein
MSSSLSWVRARGTPVLIAGLAALIAALGVSVVLTSRIDSSSLIGEALGIAAALALLVLMTYSGRRAMPAVRALGPTRLYLRVHIWGGVLFLVFFLLHTGVRLPRAGLPIALWTLSLWVVFSGLVGLWLQRTLPKLLEPSASFEAHAQRLPELAAELRRRAEGLAHTVDPAVKSYYDERIAPAMVAPRFLSLRQLGGALSAKTRAGEHAREADLLRRTLTPAGLVALEKLSELHATKYELDVHFTIQSVLRGWLVFHLPVAIALVMLVALHVFFVLYY